MLLLCVGAVVALGVACGVAFVVAGGAVCLLLLLLLFVVVVVCGL